jgi:hypothetical protein
MTQKKNLKDRNIVRNVVPRQALVVRFVMQGVMPAVKRALLVVNVVVFSVFLVVVVTRSMLQCLVPSFVSAILFFDDGNISFSSPLS